MKADYARLTMQLRMYVTHEVREIDYNYKTNKCTTFSSYQQMNREWPRIRLRCAAAGAHEASDVSSVHRG
jgi:hypothetical protein